MIPKLPPHPGIACILLLASLAMSSLTAAQTTLSDSSSLRNNSYVHSAIREIDDLQLWNSMDLDHPDLQQVRHAVRNSDIESAARAWGEYWVRKRQPEYVTSMDHLVLDTDMLMKPGDFRKEMLQAQDERDTILALAQRILRNRIKTWGDSVVEFGEKVDFNREIGQSGKYGFHYWIWARPLIMASVITGDERYLAKFDQLFNWWYDQRNSIRGGFPEFDVVFYELGLGIRNRIFIEYYLLPYPQRSAQSHARMLKTVLSAGRWLYELEKWEGYRPGNFQIHGSYMLVQLSLTFPEFREAAEWRRIGLQRMLEHLDRDFFSDGGHSERSPRNYTMSTYMTYRNLSYLLSAYNVEEEASRRIRASAERTLGWWKSILTPTGEIPAINDSHRGLFPEKVMRDGIAAFGTGSQSRPWPLSIHMPESGFTVMRTDSTRNALYLLLNHGPFAGYHTHSDLLDFELYAYGRALAVDAGVGLTYDDSLYVPWYKSSRAHNMVVVNDSNIERQGLRGENVRWTSTAGVDYFSGEESGYRRFGIKHRRQVVCVKPSYWFVLDDIHCARSADTLSWYFHSPTQLLPAANGFESVSDPGIRIIPVGIDCTTRMGRGMAASSSDLTPGRTEEVAWVRFDQLSSAQDSIQFPVLLFPFPNKGSVPGTWRISPHHFVIKNGDSTDHLYFTGGKYSEGAVQTDGWFVLLRQTEGQQRYVVLDGTYLRYHGTTLWSSTSRSSGEGIIP